MRPGLIQVTLLQQTSVCAVDGSHKASRSRRLPCSTSGQRGRNQLRAPMVSLASLSLHAIHLKWVGEWLLLVCCSQLRLWRTERQYVLPYALGISLTQSLFNLKLHGFFFPDSTRDCPVMSLGYHSFVLHQPAGFQAEWNSRIGLSLPLGWPGWPSFTMVTEMSLDTVHC